MTLHILGHSFAYEMECLLRLFYPGERIAVTTEALTDDPECCGTVLRREGDRIELEAWLRFGGADLHAADRFEPADAESWNWEAERRLGALLFGLLCDHTGQRPPWGIMTGVRPVRLCRKLEQRLGGLEHVEEALVRDYLAYPHKASLAMQTLHAQQPLLELNEPDTYSLYIGIPFCPTRCLYCSFVSHAIDRTVKLVPEYLELLCREVSHIGDIAGRLGLRLLTVYIGGGTPTTLDAAQLEQLLGTVERSFDFTHLREYTVEAGRPDTITPEKFAVLRKFSVGRVSINPQTMDDTILTEIGRAHTVQQVLDGVEMARRAGFQSLNMDLIAGLPLQTLDNFASTLDQVLALGPENVTVHTLTVKRSSNLRWRDDAYRDGPAPVDGLLQLAQQKLGGAGYGPYYLYRQQGTRQNHENVGYTLPGHGSLYNVFSMEDRHTILAAGAGGVSKLCAPGDRIKRVYNYKYPYEYISGFHTLLERKEAVSAFFQGS